MIFVGISRNKKYYFKDFDERDTKITIVFLEIYIFLKFHIQGARKVIENVVR